MSVVLLKLFEQNTTSNAAQYRPRSLWADDLYRPAAP